MARSVRDLLQRNYTCEEIDNALGFLVPEIEKKLLDKVGHFKSLKKNNHYSSETWIGLAPNMLQTPYPEIIEFVDILSHRYKCIYYIDFGAAYSRLGVVLNLMVDEFYYTGYELVKERVQNSIEVFKTNKFKNYQIFEKDIMKDFTIPKADVYFIYDFSSIAEQIQILNLFSDMLHEDKFFLVARGHGIRSLIQNKYKEFYVCNGVIHKENYSIYSSHIDLEI